MYPRDKNDFGFSIIQCLGKKFTIQFDDKISLNSRGIERSKDRAEIFYVTANALEKLKKMFSWDTDF